jgi:hypothetical protein
LYSSNPFYILSADLVFVGLRLSFGAGRSPAQAWALLAGLASYTLLLATTACVLIRLGKLWDDLRSLLVLVVIMFLAIAMNWDDSMAADPSRGAMGYLGGFLFAILVTESVLRTIQLRLPGWYRFAYYLILVVVFLYPIALTPLLGDPDRPALQWALFGFSPAAALAVVTLAPAARRGAAAVAKNGSPWRWPLYPWSLFFVMVIGLGVRAYSLCISFHYVEGSRTIFGPYFLVPIGLAVSLVWLEIGLSSRRREVIFAACALPLLLAFVAAFGHRDDQVYRDFLAVFSRTLGGSPLFLSVTGSVLFLGYAIARGAIPAGELLAVNLLALAVVGPRSFDLDQLIAPRALPLLASGVLIGLEAFSRRGAVRGTIAGVLVAAGLTQGVGELWPGADLRPIALHLGVLAVLVVGAMFEGEVGRFLRRSGAIALLVLGVSAASGYVRPPTGLPRELWHPYPLLIGAVAYGFAVLERERIYLVSCALSVTAWLLSFGAQGYAQLRRVFLGLDQVSWGMLFFLIAVAISLRKAKLWPRRLSAAVARQLTTWTPERFSRWIEVSMRRR